MRAQHKPSPTPLTSHSKPRVYLRLYGKQLTGKQHSVQKQYANYRLQNYTLKLGHGRNKLAPVTAIQRTVTWRGMTPAGRSTAQPPQAPPRPFPLLPPPLAPRRARPLTRRSPGRGPCGTPGLRQAALRQELEPQLGTAQAAPVPRPPRTPSPAISCRRHLTPLMAPGGRAPAAPGTPTT